MRYKRLAPLYLLLLAFVHAKYYSLEDANIAYIINNDSSIAVSEEITFQFYGCFSYAYRDFKLSGASIDILSVEDVSKGMKLKYITTKSADTLTVKWFYSACNERRTFRIRYRLYKALKAYNDVAELYWKIWPEAWDKQLKHLSASIILPKAASKASEVLYWGHPKLNGKIALLADKRTVLFEAFNVPAYQWVEARVVFPRSLLESTEYANIINENAKQKILREEGGFKGSFENGAKRQISRTRFLGFISSAYSTFYLLLLAYVILRIFFYFISKNIYIRPFITIFARFFLSFTLFMLAFVFFTIIMQDLILSFFLLTVPVAFVLCWYFYGRDPKVGLQAIYEREPPYNYSPAVVEALLNEFEHAPSVKSLPAELLNLALKKKIKLVPYRKSTFLGPKKSIKIEILDDTAEHLEKSEAELLEFLNLAARKTYEGWFIFEREIKDKTEPNSLTLEELQKYIKFHKYEARAFFEDWRKSVKIKTEKKLKLFSQGGYLLFASFIVLLIFLSFFYLLSFNPDPNLFPAFACACVALAASLIFAFPYALTRRTRTGVLHLQRWLRFRDFISDFSNLSNVPPEAVALWEKYLVYAIPLGVADKVQKAMEYVFRNIDVSLDESAIISASLASGIRISDFTSSFNSFSSAFSSAVSSSSFSAGGGFGGGGGGGGAG